MNQLAILNNQNKLDKIKNNEWLKDTKLTELYLKDGKYISFENQKDDIDFIHFFLYENKYRKKELSPSTEKLYQRDLIHFINFLYRFSPPSLLSDVGYKELSLYELELKENKFASSTRNRKLKLIRSLLRYGYLVEFFERDMTHYVQLPETIVNTKNERKLNRREMQLLLNEMKRKPLNRLISSFLLMTGMRISELCEASWGDIYEGINGQIMIRVKGKGDKIRRIKIRPDIFGLLLQYRSKKGLSIIIGRNSDQPLIVNTRGNKLNDRVIRYMIQRAAERVKINKNVSPHWFRHSSITFALDDGANIDAVRRFAGHSDIRTTQGYLHDLEEEKEKSAGEYISGFDI